jgi:hypothetical protein
VSGIWQPINHLDPEIKQLYEYCIANQEFFMLDSLAKVMVLRQVSLFSKLPEILKAIAEEINSCKMVNGQTIFS